MVSVAAFKKWKMFLAIILKQITPFSTQSSFNHIFIFADKNGCSSDNSCSETAGTTKLPSRHLVDMPWSQIHFGRKLK